MKRLAATLILAALAVPTLGNVAHYLAVKRREALTPTATAEITPGYANLLVWWKITTNDVNGGYVHDWSPSGVNYGTQDTAAAQFTVTNLAGVVCAYLDGGDYSSTTNTALLNGSSNLTLAVWINRSAEVANVGILAMRGGEYNALHDIGNDSFGIVAYVKNTASTYPVVTNGFKAAWMHLALTYQGGTMSLYTNGIFATSKGKTGTMSVNDVWRLGWDDADPARKWNGYLDDARIYNRCLTSQEVYNVSQEAR